MANLEGKNVLVTGGAGFIGSHLCDSLLNEPVSQLVADAAQSITGTYKGRKAGSIGPVGCGPGQEVFFPQI